MDAKTILAAIVERHGQMEITEQDLRKAQGKEIGLVQNWETEERVWKVYTSPKRTK